MTNKYFLNEKLGYFIIDNASSNDRYVAKIINLIQSNLNLEKSILQ